MRTTKNVGIPEEQYQKLKELAKKEDRPMGTVLRRIVEKALADG